jgi:hypothetical protein
MRTRTRHWEVGVMARIDAYEFGRIVVDGQHGEPDPARTAAALHLTC